MASDFGGHSHQPCWLHLLTQGRRECHAWNASCAGDPEFLPASEGFRYCKRPCHSFTCLSASSLAMPYRCWTRPASSSCFPSMTSRSSSVSLPHCCLILPLACFQPPSTLSQFMVISCQSHVSLFVNARALGRFLRAVAACRSSAPSRSRSSSVGKIEALES